MATVLYVGGANGVTTLRSDDGDAWERVDAPMPKWSVTALEVVPGQPNVVLAATRGDGVWRSEDFGATWSKPSYGKPGPGKTRCLAIDAHDPNRVYAGCEPIDIFVSDDLGSNWTLLDSVRNHPWVAGVTYPVLGMEPHVRDIVIDPTDSETIYAALQVGYIMKSTDGGASWVVLDQGLDADVHTIVVDPVDTDHITISTGGDNSRLGTAPGKALYASRDAGKTWVPLAMDYSQEYGVPVTLKPGHPEVAYASLAVGTPSRWGARDKGADAILVRTKDGGGSWEVADLSRVPDASRSMVFAIEPDPANASHLYAVMSDGAFIRSTDDGESWTPMDLQIKGTSDLKCVSA